MKQRTISEKVVESVMIDTPRGKATVCNREWVADDKQFEIELNRNFGKNSDEVTSAHIFVGVADEILADRAAYEYGGKIARVKKKTIRVTISDDSVI